METSAKEIKALVLTESEFEVQFCQNEWHFWHLRSIKTLCKAQNRQIFNRLVQKLEVFSWELDNEKEASC